MTNTTDTSLEPSGNMLKDAVYGWNRFWFQPSNPTSLALVRILAGLMALYIHASYTYDLFNFYGRDGWISSQAADEMRLQMPVYGRGPDWNEMSPWNDDYYYQKPPTADEKQYMHDWDGSNPRQTVFKGFYAWSIWFYVSDPTWVPIVHGACLVIFFLFTIGFCTRVTAVLAWLAALSYIQRVFNSSLFGVDTMMNFTLLYLMIGPSGAALSVDRLIQRYVNAWRALRARGSGRKAATVAAASIAKAEGLELDTPQPRISATLALRLIQIHVCIVYLISGMSKLQGQAWWNGTAVWGTMANPEFSPMGYGWYVATLRWLCEHRLAWELFVCGSALATLVFELGFAFLVWNRWTRWAMVLGAVMMHTGIAFFMGLTTFSLMMVSAVSSFIPLAALLGLLTRLGKGRQTFELAYAPRDRKQVRWASLVRAFDPWNQVHLLEQTGVHHEEKVEGPANGIVSAEKIKHHGGEHVASGPLQLISDNGEVLTGFAIFERLTRALHLLWPLALVTKIPGVSSLGFSRFPERNTTKSPLVEGERRKVMSEKVTH